MKTPQQLADEEAIDICREVNLSKELPLTKYDMDRISTHLLPLYECVEVLREVNTGHTDKCKAMFGGKCNCGYDKAKKVLSDLSTPTTEKKEGE